MGRKPRADRAKLQLPFFQKVVRARLRDAGPHTEATGCALKPLPLPDCIEGLIVSLFLKGVSLPFGIIAHLIGLIFEPLFSSGIHAVYRLVELIGLIFHRIGLLIGVFFNRVGLCFKLVFALIFSRWLASSKANGGCAQRSHGDEFPHVTISLD
jgi:hypothetical protein